MTSSFTHLRGKTCYSSVNLDLRKEVIELRTHRGKRGINKAASNAYSISYLTITRLSHVTSHFVLEILSSRMIISLRRHTVLHCTTDAVANNPNAVQCL